jgi:hypothetical protein
MRTLTELRAYVREAFPHSFDEASMIKVRIAVAGAEETVGLAVIEYGEQACVLVMADVCGEDALSPLRALDLNRDIAAGTLVPVGGRYLLRQVMPLDDATAPFIRWTCGFVAQHARRVRNGLMRAVHDGACYAHFVE